MSTAQLIHLRRYNVGKIRDRHGKLSYFISDYCHRGRRKHVTLDLEVFVTVAKMDQESVCPRCVQWVADKFQDPTDYERERGLALLAGV